MRRALVMMAAVALMTTVAQAATATPARWAVCGRWRAVPAPVPPPGYGKLTDVAVVSPTEAWTVGWVGTQTSSRPVALHWTGLQWSPTHVPIPERTGVTLASVAIAADGVWTVGGSLSAKSGEFRPFVARWTDGRWHRSHVGYRREGWLTSVATVPGSRQAWAVGSSMHVAIALRWNGTAWRSLHASALGDSSLNAIVAFRSGVAWAVGSTLAEGRRRALTARWDGHAWHPRPQGLSDLSSVAGASPRSVWATGSRPDHGYRHLRAVIYRWNGERWARAFVSAFHATLNDIVPAGPGNVWAVGERERGFGRPLVVRREESGWGVSAAPDVIGGFAAIAGTPQNLWVTRDHNTEGGPAGQYDTYHRC